LNNHIFLTVGRLNATSDLVTQRFIQVPSDSDKQKAFVSLIKKEQLSTLVFFETKKDVDIMHNLLEDENIRVASVHGDRTQEQRNLAIKSFASGKVKVLLATNVAARGLDIKNIGHVVNYELPKDMDDYVHRIGRTGRSGQPGVATSFISEEAPVSSLRKLKDILVQGKQEVPKWLDQVTQAAQRQPQTRGRPSFSRFGQSRGQSSSQGGSWSSNRDRPQYQNSRRREQDDDDSDDFAPRQRRRDPDEGYSRNRYPPRESSSSSSFDVNTSNKGVEGLAGILDALSKRK